MHMQGTPQTMQADPHYEDVVSEVAAFFNDRFQRLRACGVAAEQIVFDPGIGFGKTAEHNLLLLGALARLAGLDRPVLVGASRKSFMGRLPGAAANDRLAASLACACAAVQAGAQIVRAHDVAETVQAIRMTEAILARRI
jgi:dihydropteroate synthase